MLIMAFIFSANTYARILIGAVFILKYYYFIFKIETIKGGYVDDGKQKANRTVR
jgi:hypothetical protein